MCTEIMHLHQIVVQIEQLCVFHRYTFLAHQDELLLGSEVSSAADRCLFQEPSGSHNLQIDPSSLART